MDHILFIYLLITIKNICNVFGQFVWRDQKINCQQSIDKILLCGYVNILFYSLLKLILCTTVCRLKNAQLLLFAYSYLAK